VARRAPVDLNRPTDRPQLQLVADANSTSFGERLWQCDLELPRHFSHAPIVASIKDSVKDFALIHLRSWPSEVSVAGPPE